MQPPSSSDQVPERVGEQVARLLDRLAEGDQSAALGLLPLLYGKLKRVATHFMRGERVDHTLHPTALVNDALLSLLGGGSMYYAARHHCVRVASQAVRHVLVDHARSRAAAIRNLDRVREPMDSV